MKNINFEKPICCKECGIVIGHTLQKEIGPCPLCYPEESKEWRSKRKKVENDN